MRPKTYKSPNYNRFMLGMAVSALSLKPGETRTCGELADFCNTTRQNISLIEHNAIRKIRRKLREIGIRGR